MRPGPTDNRIVFANSSVAEDQHTLGELCDVVLVSDHGLDVSSFLLFQVLLVQATIAMRKKITVKTIINKSLTDTSAPI